MVLNFSPCKGCEILIFHCVRYFAPVVHQTVLRLHYHIFFVEFFHIPRQYLLDEQIPFLSLLQVTLQSKHVHVNLEVPYGQQSPCLQLNIGTAQFFCNLCQSLVDTFSNRKLLHYLKKQMVLSGLSYRCRAPWLHAFFISNAFFQLSLSFA